MDTERGSASKYVDIFNFDVMDLGTYNPLNLIEIIGAAAQADYQVLCIDSLSHFWMGKEGELDQVDRAARRMQSPNNFAAWKHVTPIHNQLIDKITSDRFTSWSVCARKLNGFWIAMTEPGKRSRER